MWLKREKAIACIEACQIMTESWHQPASPYFSMWPDIECLHQSCGSSSSFPWTPDPVSVAMPSVLIMGKIDIFQDRGAALAEWPSVG